MEAIEKYTPPDEIVVYYRARTATLYTDRQALQTTSFNNMVTNGDWFMQNKKDNYSQVVATADQLAASRLRARLGERRLAPVADPRRSRRNSPRVHQMFNRCSTARQSPVHHPDTSGWEGRRMALNRRQLIHHGAAGAGLVVVGNLANWFPDRVGGWRPADPGRPRRCPTRQWPFVGDRLRPARPRPDTLLDLPEGFSYTIISETGKPLTGAGVMPDAFDGTAVFEAGRSATSCATASRVTARRRSRSSSRQSLLPSSPTTRSPSAGRRRPSSTPTQRRGRVRQPGRHERQLRRRRHPVGHVADVRGDRGRHRRRRVHQGPRLRVRGRSVQRRPTTRTRHRSKAWAASPTRPS